LAMETTKSSETSFSTNLSHTPWGNQEIKLKYLVILCFLPSCDVLFLRPKFSQKNSSRTPQSRLFL
jgi:hypothetical protein